MVLYVCEKRYKWSNKDEEWREMWSHVKKKSRINRDLRLCFRIKEFICNSLILISIVQFNLLIIQRRVTNVFFESTKENFELLKSRSMQLI